MHRNTALWKSYVGDDSRHTNMYNQHDWKIILPETNNTNKTISVLISAYNAKKWIKTAVKSILSQRLPEGWKLELIVGTDGCEDTYNSISEIEDKRLGIVKFKNNQGTYNTFNSIASLSTGNILQRFDADDIMNEGWLHRVISSFTLNDDVNLIYGNCHNISEDLKHILPVTRVGVGVEVLTPYNTDGPAAWRASYFFNYIGGYKALPCGSDSEVPLDRDWETEIL